MRCAPASMHSPVRIWAPWCSRFRVIRKSWILRPAAASCLPRKIRASPLFCSASPRILSPAPARRAGQWQRRNRFLLKTGVCRFSTRSFSATGTARPDIGSWSGVQTMVSSGEGRARRILAIWLPRLPTDRIRRRKDCAVPPDAPLIVTVKANNALSLLSVDASAARLSLKAGMPLANARAIVPHLIAIEADINADAKLLEAVADWCDRFTPFVARDGDDGLLLDITGATHLFGGEKAMLAHMRALFAKQKFAAQFAIAGS